MSQPAASLGPAKRTNGVLPIRSSVEANVVIPAELVGLVAIRKRDYIAATTVTLLKQIVGAVVQFVEFGYLRVVILSHCV